MTENNAARQCYYQYLKANGLIVGWYRSTSTHGATNNHIIDHTHHPLCKHKIVDPALRFQAEPTGRIDCVRCDKIVKLSMELDDKTC